MRVHNFRSRRTRGSTVVEFALVAPIVLLLMCAILEFSVLFFTTMTMQYAVREGARYGITGQTDKDPTGANLRYKAILQVMRNNSVGMYDMVSPVITVNSTTYATSSAYTTSMFGSPGDIVVIRLDCSWKFVTPLIGNLFKDGKLSFAVAATMQNESWNSL